MNESNSLEERIEKIEKKINNIDIFASLLKLHKFNKDELVLLHKYFFDMLKFKNNTKLRDALVKGGSNYKLVNNLKIIIKKSSYTQKELAQFAGIEYKTFSNILNNRYNPSLEVALKLSCILNKSVNDLFRIEIIENME